MKKIKLVAVFTVMAMVASFAGHAQTATKAQTQKAPAKDQTVAPAKQSGTTSSTTSTTTTKSSTTTAHKAHKKTTVNGTAKPAPAKTKATAPTTSHFGPRSHANANYAAMKGKHKKGHHKDDSKKAPSGNGK